MKISIVDTSPVLAGSTGVEAFKTTAELAQLADQAGFSRYWLSELHGVRTNAGTTPEVAVAAVATLGEVFWDSTRLTELAKTVGYERYWVAEHHNMPWLASSSPAALVAHVAAPTTGLSVGSGGVMLPNYAPL
jgi:alkanesulfonate monooxygenase SsuD/methylene tetrahydromethanopterin reductase-like flavin-dependent oxidoreductase (luciferase family)